MKAAAKTFALSIDNSGYQASLIPGKVYRILPDPRAALDDLVRIVDESGEDYLYHKESFCVCGFSTSGEEEDPCLGGRLIKVCAVVISIHNEVGLAEDPGRKSLVWSL